MILAGKIWRCVVPPILTGNALAVAKDTVIKAPEAKPKRRKLSKFFFCFYWGSNTHQRHDRFTDRQSPPRYGGDDRVLW